MCKHRAAFIIRRVSVPVRLSTVVLPPLFTVSGILQAHPSTQESSIWGDVGAMRLWAPSICVAYWVCADNLTGLCAKLRPTVLKRRSLDVGAGSGWPGVRAIYPVGLLHRRQSLGPCGSCGHDVFITVFHCVKIM